MLEEVKDTGSPQDGGKVPKKDRPFTSLRGGIGSLIVGI